MNDTFVDRAVAWFSPQAGVERRRARQWLAFTAGGYVGGRRDRKGIRNWRPDELSANAAINDDLASLRSRSRDLVRNTPLATGAIGTVTTSVVGNGLALRASVDRDILGWTEEAATEWRRATEREWQLFTKRADMTRVQGFDELQALIFRSVLESGDVLIGRRFREDLGDAYGLKLQVIEADRLSNPQRAGDSDTIIAGVEHSPNGVPIAYHISSNHPGDLKTQKWTRVVSRDAMGSPVILHLFDRLRPDQARGVPYLAPVIEAIKQLGDYADAEVRAAVVSAMFTVFVTSPEADGIGSIIGDNANVKDPDTEIELGSGAVVDLMPGETVEQANPLRPNSGYSEFVQAFTRQIGVALGLPFEVLTMHFSSSYSASRAALEMAWQFYRVRRGWLARRLCQPVYEWFLAEAVARGRINAPGFFGDPLTRSAYCACEWVGPSRMQLDPLKEANADAKDLESRVTTRQKIILERKGGNFEDTHDQLVRENNLAKEDGLNPPEPSAQPDGTLGEARKEEDDD